MRACVFAGPSLGRLRPDLPDGVVLLPPAARGDLYRAALRGPRVIGLIDGYFDGVPAVAHKEILWALDRGIHVLGASSMGALRAAELSPYGMRGVGEVFRAYAAGEVEADDEVAVLHGPAEAGWVGLSEAMVNVRATLRAAHNQGVLDRAAAEAVTLAAGGLFYKERTWPAVAQAAAASGVGERDLARFAAWLPRGRVDQKRADALLLLDEVATLLAADPPPFRPTFAFESTQIWDDLAAEAAPAGSDENDETNPAIAALLLGELRLGSEEACRPLVDRALARLLALREAERAGVAAGEGASRERLERLRVELGLFRAADRKAWLASREVDPGWLGRRAEGDALASAVARDLAPAIDAALLDELRLAPDFPERLARARRKRELLDGADTPEAPVPASLPLWLARRLGRDEPLNGVELGFTDAGQFYRALLAEYLYFHLLETKGNASSDK